GIGSPVGGGFARPIFWGNNGGRLLAFDVGDTTAPKFLSDVNLATNSWWNFSPPFALNGSVYLSHSAVVPFRPVAGNAKGTNSPQPDFWVQRWFLDVVDYSDPAEPAVRMAVNIPGTLQGVSRGGELLYTVGQHWTNPANGWSDGSEYLDASAYDGVEAHLIDSLKLSSYWPHPVLVNGDAIFVGHPAETTNGKNLLEAWTLSSAGKFMQLGKTELSGAAQNFANFGNLL